VFVELVDGKFMQASITTESEGGTYVSNKRFINKAN